MSKYSNVVSTFALFFAGCSLVLQYAERYWTPAELQMTVEVDDNSSEDDAVHVTLSAINAGRSAVTIQSFALVQISGVADFGICGDSTTMFHVRTFPVRSKRYGPSPLDVQAFDAAHKNTIITGSEKILILRGLYADTSVGSTDMMNVRIDPGYPKSLFISFPREAVKNSLATYCLAIQFIESRIGLQYFVLKAWTQSGGYIQRWRVLQPIFP